MRVVGAGIGRTGTHSLKLALEQLLGAPCYHMLEVFQHPEHVELWARAARGELDDWDEIFGGYAAAVDWPASAFWRELSDAQPEAVVLLSTRESADAWWRSADQTIWEAMRRDPGDEMRPWFTMVSDVLSTRFDERWDDRDAAMAAYERHNAEVRATVPGDRLVDWRPGDGWAPICDALGVAVPDTPFPHVNTTEEFRAMLGADSA
jgi:hypothetical protein